MKNKKSFYIISSVCILAIIGVCFLIYINWVSQNETLIQVKIQPDRDTYAPYMSSTVGIGLTPEYILDRPLETVKFHWITDYGHFVSWGPTDYKVYVLEPDITIDASKIYWSYDPNEAQVEKPPVKIILRIEDAQSGKLLAEASLEIGWEQIYTAKVKK